VEASGGMRCNYSLCASNGRLLPLEKKRWSGVVAVPSNVLI
jgi:hypothetical protein